jgi:DNA mismatch repair protein MutS2
MKEAKEQASQIINEAKNVADESIRKYNRWLQQGGNIKDMEAERAMLRERLSESSDSPIGKSPKSGKKIAPKSLELGDSVFVTSLGLRGTVSTLPNPRGDLLVQMGALSSQVNVKDLEAIEEDEKKPRVDNISRGGKIKMSKSASISPEINLIGKTVDEALSLLDKYLDDAYLSHIPTVTVIHGRGTGALRNAVHSFLKKSKYVKDYRVGGYNEGNTGATIVEFK